MRQPTRAHGLVVGVAALTLVVAACGDDGGTEADTDGAPTEEAAGEDTVEDAGTVEPAPASGTVVYELPGEEVYPEGVAYDPATDRFFVSATADGAIFVGDRGTGAVETFVEGGADGRSTAVGLAVDPERRHLWVAGGDDQTVTVYDADDAGLVTQFTAASVPGGFVNDVAVAEDGTAYVTDSGGSRGAILTATADGDLEDWLELDGTPIGAGAATNGIAVTPDGADVVVVDLVGGSAWRIDRAGLDVTEVAAAGVLAAPDGIAVFDDRMYVVGFQGVDRLDLADDGTAAGPPERTTDAAFAFPTTGAAVGEERFLVVNSQFDQRDAGTPSLPFTVVEIDQP